MVAPTQESDVVAVLHSLSDPVRLEIVRQLAEQPDGGELSCGQLELPVGKSTCSHHLKNLACAGVTAEREELERRYPGLIDSVLRALLSAPRPADTGS